MYLIRNISLLVLFLTLFLASSLGLIYSLTATLTLYLILGGWKFVYIMIKTFPRDMTGAKVLILMKLKLSRIIRNKETIATLFTQTAARFPHKDAFIFENEHWTFKRVDEYSNAVANYLLSAGYRPGDVIALFMGSRPEYVCLWLGMTKAGIVAALINFNLRNESLIHCIQISGAKAVVFGADLVEAVRDILPQLREKHSAISLYSLGDPQAASVDSSVAIDQHLLKCSTQPVVINYRADFSSLLFYIYTSGTTGLPKAARVTHSRFFFMCTAVNIFFKITPDDIIYDTLPLYHTAGGVLGVGQSILHGSTVVIKSKFSASRFWEDCIKYRCTIAQYIGEICRYLLAQPAKATDTQHTVRLTFGNGIRPQIWEEFQKRFQIKQIGEFYGATEGNANLCNYDNTVGSCGFLSRMAPSLYPVRLIRVDEDTGEPIRDHNGLCIMCQPGEPGELVGKIIEKDPLRNFDGYASKAATTKKIAYDVFTKGDKAFLTGDLLVMDQYGYLYFRDRTGDTFRWKGENVSTSEVEAVISNLLDLQDAVVYGVEVPGAEGRAGMVAIASSPSEVDLSALRTGLLTRLPPYALPVFVRFTQAVDTTGTFKLKKTDLRKAGFNPQLISDPLFYYDSSQRTYSPLTPSQYEAIRVGQIRV